MAKQIYDRVTFILYGEDIWRVAVNVDDDGVIVVTVDLHGKKCAEALRIIKQIITLIQVPFIFDIIHGYNNGTAIKDLIWNQVEHKRVKEKFCNAWNPGETFLRVA